MKQEVIAGVILCAMGLAMLLFSPNAWWKAAEKWKTRDGGERAATSYTILCAWGGGGVFRGRGPLYLEQSVNHRIAPMRGGGQNRPAGGGLPGDGKGMTVHDSGDEKAAASGNESR